MMGKILNNGIDEKINNNGNNALIKIQMNKALTNDKNNCFIPLRDPELPKQPQRKTYLRNYSPKSKTSEVILRL